MISLVDRAAAPLERIVDRIDRAAVRWLMARIDLPRPLSLKLLEHLAARTGAKLEVTELPS